MVCNVHCNQKARYCGHLFAHPCRGQGKWLLWRVFDYHMGVGALGLWGGWSDVDGDHWGWLDKGQGGLRRLTDG